MGTLPCPVRPDAGRLEDFNLSSSSNSLIQFAKIYRKTGRVDPESVPSTPASANEEFADSVAERRYPPVHDRARSGNGTRAVGVTD